ncbi:unnamed protein product [Allacma fusca]|uniref:Uncharacterized protein n=1 Tax=Allacma fusca TaxID=39272 RepID=A0A8J2JEP3_9HEXA|nr:unnamed protein product [Allacma fusca]
MLFLASLAGFTIPVVLLYVEASPGLAVKYDPLSKKEADLSKQPYFKELVTEPPGIDNNEKNFENFEPEKRDIWIPEGQKLQLEDIPWYNRFGNWLQGTYHSAKTGVHKFFSMQDTERTGGQPGGYPDFYSFNY